VPAGDISFWQAAIRDRDDAQYEPLRRAIAARSPIFVDVLYGDHEVDSGPSPASISPAQSCRRRGALAVAVLDLAPWNLDRAEPR